MTSHVDNIKEILKEIEECINLTYDGSIPKQENLKALQRKFVLEAKKSAYISAVKVELNRLKSIKSLWCGKEISYLPDLIKDCEETLRLCGELK